MNTSKHSTEDQPHCVPQDSTPQDSAPLDGTPLYGVIVAGGSSSRMQLAPDEPPSKLLMKFAGRTIIELTIDNLVDAVEFNDLVLVVPQELIPNFTQALLSSHSQIPITAGGSCRQLSVLKGLQLLTGRGAAPEGLVLVHDGARCLTDPVLTRRCVTAARQHSGVIAAIPSTDTLKVVKDGVVVGSVDRSTIWRSQTPQIMPLGKLKTAMESCDDLTQFSDDAALLEGSYPIKVVVGDNYNIKVTSRADLGILRGLLESSS